MGRCRAARWRFLKPWPARGWSVSEKRCTPLRRIGGAFICLWVASVPGAALACGSMGLDRPSTLAAVLVGIAIPALLLIPLELTFLKKYGRLGERAVSAYLALLVAKGTGLTILAQVGRPLLENIFVIEFLYSVIHFVLACAILRIFFRLQTPEAVIASALVSTVIPWGYSISAPVFGVMAWWLSTAYS